MTSDRDKKIDIDNVWNNTEEDLSKPPRFYDIVKDKVKFNKDKCKRKNCYYYLISVDSREENCKLFEERLIDENRCQRCIDIFGE